MRQRRRARARRDTLNVQPRSPFYSGRGLGAREQLAPSVLKRTAAVVGLGGTKGLEREQGVNQGEGRKDSRRAQPESAGYARPGAGLGMTRPGHCQHCSPCPVRAVTPPTAEPTREGAPAAKQQGVQGISPGPYFHALALDLDLGLVPACSVFSHNKVSSGLFVCFTPATHTPS